MWPFDEDETKKISTSGGFSKDKTGTTQTTKEEFETAAEATVNRVKEAIGKFTLMDDAKKLKAEDYEFSYTERQTKSGKLIIFGDSTINMDYVTDIAVSDIGAAHSCTAYSGDDYSSQHYYTTDIRGPHCASIKITYTSGREIEVKCYHHVLEAVYGGLLKIWHNS